MHMNFHKSRKYTVKLTFHKKFTPTHQNGKRVPIKLQSLVKEELQKLIDKKLLTKVNSCSDKKTAYLQSILEI